MGDPVRDGHGARPESPLDFAAFVHVVVSDIPEGRVMTYGDVAAELGSLGARAVGRILATSDGSGPWWRVIGADGRPPAGHEAEALEHYEREGTPLRWVGARGEPDAYRIDLAQARHRFA